MQANGNVNYIASIEKSQEDQELTQPQQTFMHKILGDDYVADEQIVSDGNDTVIIQVNVVNLDNFLENTHHHEMLFVNLSNNQIQQQEKEKLPSTPITPRSKMEVKQCFLISD